MSSKFLRRTPNSQKFPKNFQKILDSDEVENNCYYVFRWETGVKYSLNRVFILFPLLGILYIPYGWSEASYRLYVIRALGYFCYSMAVFGDY